MKNLILGIACMACLYTTPFAQQAVSSNYHRYTAIKFAPGGLAAGKVTVGGEYNFRYRNSITLLAGLPFDQTQKIDLYGSKDNVHTKAFSIMAGYRYYLGQKTMNGFYIEPYVKYLKQQASGLINADLYSYKAVFDSHSNYTGIGAGAQLGAQFTIAKLFLFDFFLIGPEANSAKFSSYSVDIANNVPWNYADEQEAEKKIKDALKDIPVIGTKVQVKVDKENKTVTTGFSGFAPGFRIGASIGIRF